MVEGVQQGPVLVGTFFRCMLLEKSFPTDMDHLPQA